MEKNIKNNRVRHYLADTDLEPGEILKVLALAAKIKKQPQKYRAAFKNKTVALLFEKLSLRTKFTLQIGVHEMGGFTVVNDGRIPDREPVADIARNLTRWVDLVAARVYSHSVLEDLARHSEVPVVNALSDLYHPCQILADMLTLKEHFGDLKKIKIAFVGDGNNVANSLILASGSLGLNMAIATPKGYEPRRQIIARAEILNNKSGGKFSATHNIAEAVKNADVIYTDTWVSMGDEKDAAKRREDFKNFQVTTKTFKQAKPNAMFMHCLPKHPNEEVAEEVFESARSLVFEQAENRLHAIKALLFYLLSSGGKVK